MQEAVYDRAKSEFESLEIAVSEPVADYFDRVNVVLTKLTKHQVTTPAREIKRRVVSDLTPRFSDEVRVNTIKEDVDFKDLEAGLARVESFKSDVERRNA